MFIITRDFKYMLKSKDLKTKGTGKAESTRNRSILYRNPIYYARLRLGPRYRKARKEEFEFDITDGLMSVAG